MRITTQMMMQGYKRNVGDAFSSMNKAMQTAYDYRSFERPSDNPLAAAQTFEVHWEMSQNADYSSNVQNLQGVAKTADGILQNVDSLLTEANGTNTLKGINGDMNADNRKTIANQLLSIRDSIVSKMNAKYGDSYIFGGANSSSAPFQMINDQLYYRGINVDTGENLNGASAELSFGGKTTQIDFGKDNGANLNSYQLIINTSNSNPNTTPIDNTNKTITLNFSSANPTKKDLQDALQNLHTQTLAGGKSVDFSKVTVEGNQTDAVNIDPSTHTGSSAVTDMVGDAGLKALADEDVYVDIGLGITSANGKVDDQSAFNSSMPGIGYLGYGTRTVTNDDGSTTNVPCNVCSLLTKIADCLQNNSSESNTDLIKQVSPYISSFKTSQSGFESGQTELGQQMNFLNDTASYLSDMKINFSEKDNNVEYVDYTDAIDNFYMQQYCYNAALKVGGQILQQSLMDYLK